MPQLLMPVLMIAGMVVGAVLFRLPGRLFYRDTTWLPEDEFRAAFPEKQWVTWAMYGLVPLGFAVTVAVLATTEDMNKGANWLFFYLVFFGCMGAVPAVPELGARASVAIPVGHGSPAPVLFTVSPNAYRAAAFRLSMAALVLGVFLWSR